LAVSAKLYGAFLNALATKKIDLSADTFRVMLCTSAYTPDQDAHDFKNDVTNEVTGTGYTAGGAVLTSVTLMYDGATNTLKFDAADTVWSNATITARYAIIYDATPGTDATRPLIGFVDFGADVSSTSAAFTISWDAAGIFTLTVA
jgi:hypothetical protein